ncbi:MAG: hypothetical protein A3I29_03340 [Candidatus Magasanikbacteria bacterium RIFCSPLOWO2_02_FULL_44_11]|uniref:Methyltransferase type 11 domain-containing protein n=2 Tax=Candidatus Magasanikiibacteriota TaxID=1752731 RepID=A0A1F6NB13_9BACT|nr:MAG: hypothetical protein A3D53_01870 [Candidatus Magasanikbacteria bacterium RIFCSPHIGHO2_02_FULL_45_10]OGH80903.1 MAG: hypothetical protein A3I29_03340 [Candidatus Magasanikbacteria bacterium RIFCSPLOWO2_02_FULL_44_11]
MTEKERFDPHIEGVSAEERFNLLLDRDRVIPAEYTNLIAKQDTRDNKERFQRTEYSETWLDLHGKRAETARDFFKQKLTGHPFIDLGGGIGLMRGIASEFGATEYINVDRQYHENLPPNPFEIRHSAPLGNKQNACEIDVHADMLDFVSRLKDGVASFTLNGIDYSIVDDPEYHKALAREIIRATRKDGLIFSIRSMALSEILEQLSMGEKLPVKQVNLQQETGFKLVSPLGHYIFEKVE